MTLLRTVTVKIFSDTDKPGWNATVDVEENSPVNAEVMESLTAEIKDAVENAIEEFEGAGADFRDDSDEEDFR